MSPKVFIAYASILLFLMVVNKVDSQECGKSSYESNPDPSVIVTEKGNARQGLWPWMVAITKKFSGSIYLPYCSGFLIDRRHIISAAHCFDKKGADLYRARIGKINQNEGDEYHIQRILVHPGHNLGKFYDDIAILTLERAITSRNVNPICLPDEEVTKMNLTDRRTAVAGWGPKNRGGNIDIYQKFRTGLRVISNEQCEKMVEQMLGSNFRLQFPDGINRDLICTTVEDIYDVCLGSGGPLMIQNGNRWFAVGVISFGFRCDGVPDGYVNITNYIDWIRQNTEQDCGVRKYENSPDETMWPWMAAIRKKERTGVRSWCSGFLIDTRHVISAAHCYYDDKKIKKYRVRIGHVNQEEGNEYRISRIVIHSGYTNGIHYNDIAILTLDREVNSKNFNPICLPDDEIRKMNLIGKSTTEVGWGTESPGGFKHGHYLNQLNGQIIMSNQQCGEMLGEQLKGNFQRTFPRGIDEGILCATFGESGDEICISSGAPLMILKRNRWFAVGVASFGISCGLPGMPYGYTNITNYFDWIRQNTSD